MFVRSSIAEVPMQITRRVYVSRRIPHLPSNLNDLKWGVVEEIEKLGYVPEIFTNPKGRPGLASAKSWSPDGAVAVIDDETRPDRIRPPGKADQAHFRESLDRHHECPA